MSNSFCRSFQNRKYKDNGKYEKKDKCRGNEKHKDKDKSKDKDKNIDKDKNKDKDKYKDKETILIRKKETKHCSSLKEKVESHPPFHWHLAILKRTVKIGI